MAKILNIETSTIACSVALATDGEVIALEESFVRNSHAENVTVFSESVLKQAGLTFHDLDAIAVSMGPGSYTGLRIGVSTAKGFCYSLDKPLIAIGTLKAMAKGMISKTENSEDYHYCPMIDARRMEVYSALFDHNLNEVRKTEAEIIDSGSFSNHLKDQKLLFAGDGAEKCKIFLESNSNAYFIDELFPSAKYMSNLSEQKYLNEEFENVAYFEPFYLKDFVAGLPKVKGLK